MQLTLSAAFAAVKPSLARLVRALPQRPRLAGLVACCAIAASGAAVAQYPERPVQLVVPWASGSDNVLRALAIKAGQHMGQSFVIQNKPGAAGTMAPATVARTGKADGYEIVQIPISVFRLPHLQRTDYDPRTDFTYIISLAGYTSGVVVRADAPWQTFAELVADAKRNPGKVSVGTSGVNTTVDITMKQIARKDRIRWTDVPFKGTSETMTALLGGHVSVLAGTSAAWGPFVDSGKVRLLVTWGDERTARWPAVPTLKELGYGIVAKSPYGLAGPKGMPANAVKAIHDAFKKALDDPEMKQMMQHAGEEAAYLNSEDYRKYAEATYEEQERIVRELGLRADAPRP